VTPAVEHYRRFAPGGGYDTIVVGSGIGGLTAAAMLARHGGRRVLVLERHTVAGGFTHVFHRGGFEWDTGVHYVGGVGVPGSRERAVFDHVTEGRLRWQPMPEVFERFRFGDREYRIPSGEQPYREALCAYFPRERRAIDRYLRATRRVVSCGNLYFATRVLPRPLARLLGPLLRFPFLRHARQITGARLARLTADPALRALLAAQWADYGLPPGSSSFGAHAIVAQHFLPGAAYPVGGASRIAASIAPVIARAGGAIVVGAEVASVLVERGTAVGVRMADGREIRARHVVSDAGARNTYARLLPEGCPGRAAALAELAGVPPSVAHVCLYVGLRSDDPAEFGVANLWQFPDHDHDGNWERHLADELAPLPGVFVSFPAAKDPTFAQRYPGRATIQVLAPAAYARCAPWQDAPWQQRGDAYDAWKQRWRQRLVDALERAVRRGRTPPGSSAATPTTPGSSVGASAWSTRSSARCPRCAAASSAARCRRRCRRATSPTTNTARSTASATPPHGSACAASARQRPCATCGSPARTSSPRASPGRWSPA